MKTTSAAAETAGPMRDEREEGQSSGPDNATAKQFIERAEERGYEPCREQFQAWATRADALVENAAL